MVAINTPCRVLVIDPDLTISQKCMTHLEAGGHRVQRFADLGSVNTEMQMDEIDAVFLAWPDGDFQQNGDALTLTRSWFTETPVFLAVPPDEVTAAVKAMQEGVCGYLLRPYHTAEIDAILATIQQRKQIRPAVRPQPDAALLPKNGNASSLVAGKSVLPALSEISDKLATAVDETVVLQKITDTLVAASGYKIAYFRLRQPDNSLTITAASGSESTLQASTLTEQAEIDGRVLQTGQAEVITDILEDNYLALPPPSPYGGVRGVLATPIKLADRVVGILTCGTAQPHLFAPDERHLLTTFANLAAVALEKTRRLQRTRQQTRELGMLYETALATGSVLEADELLMRLYEQIRQLMVPDSFHIFLYEEENELLKVELAIEAGQEMAGISGRRVPLDEGGLAGWVMLTRLPLLVNDLQAEKLPAEPRFQAESTRTWLGVPLIVNNRLTGALVVQSYRPYAFGDADRRLLTSMAAQAAITLENARLFATASRQVAELRRLERAGEALAGVVQVNEALHTIVQNVPIGTKAKGVFIALYDTATQQFDLDRAVGIGLGEGVAVWRGKQPQPGNIIDSIFKNQIVIVEDLAAATSRQIGSPEKTELLENGIQAFVGLRLQTNAPPDGVLFINYSQPYSPQEDELATLRIYADQTAVTIERARLFERLRREQELIREVAKATGSVKNLHDTWHEILEGAIRLTGADRGNISQVDESSGLLQDVINQGNSQTLSSALALLVGKQGIQGWVAAHKEPALVYNVEDEEWKDIYYMGDPATRSELAVPIKRGEHDELVGIINLESSREGAFTKNDQQLLESLAIHADIAVQNAELYENITQQVQRLSTLLEVGQRMTAISPIIEELREVVESLRTFLEYDVVTLYAYDPYRQEFERPITSGKLNVEIAVRPIKRGGLEWKLLQYEGRDDYFTPDSANDPLLAGPFVQREHIRSSGVIRLRASGQIVGLLFVNKRSPHAFNEQEQEMVQKYADRAASIIHNASIFQSIVDGLQQAMAFDVVTLYLYDARQKTFGAPVVAGRLRQPRNWGRVQPGSLIWRAIGGESSHFTTDASTDPILSGPFVQREEIKTSGYVRLEVRDQPVGILFVNWRHRHVWDEAEKRAVQLFANQAAITIQNTHQYKALEKNQQQLDALHEAGKILAMAGLDTDAVLQTILEQAVGVTGAHFGTLQLLEEDKLEFVATLPAEEKQRLREKFNRMPTNGPGITARAVRQNAPQLVPDVSIDKDFLNATGETKSELAVVLQREGDPVGVLNVEHKEVHGLTEKDQELLTAFSHLAVVALQNAEQYKELEKTRDRQLASQAVAWLGLLGADWQHTINQETFSIANYVEGLKEWLQRNDAPPEVRKQVFRALKHIEEVATSIRTVQFTSQVPPDSPTGEMLIDRELPGIVERWCSERPDVNTKTDLNCSGIKVKISCQWFTVAMEKLIKNALRAMPGGGELEIITEPAESNVHITIKDTGTGIPPSVRPYFLKRVISPREQKSGTGMGALIARFVALSHDGDLVLVDSSPEKGTELQMRLPIAKESMKPEGVISR